MTITPTDTTELVIAGVGLPPYSSRGLTQTLEPISQSVQLYRTINGNLIDLSDSAFRKYLSTISGDDQQPPAVDLVWPGALVIVNCIEELSQPDETDAVLGRPAVPGSQRVEDGFIFYRPVLNMRVRAFSIECNEWGAQIRWSLSLEEI